MRILTLAILAASAAACGKNAAPVPDEAARAAVAAAPIPAERADIREEDLAAHIRTLASDAFEGRAPTTPGGEKTRAYIAGEFARIGLSPMGDDWFQDVAMVELTVDPAKSSLSIAAAGGAPRTLAYKTEAVYGTRRVTPSVSFQDSELVFVGYGIVAPEYGWNDYAGVDVKGKTVVILVNDPGYATQDPALFTGNAMTYYGRWTYKFEEAARQGAAAALVVHDDKPAGYGWNVVEGSWSGPQLDIARADDGASRVMLEGWVTNGVARELMAAAGLDLADMMQKAKTRGSAAVPMTGLAASATLEQSIKRSSDANVIGVLRGAEAPDEYVLYMGHWDHLGVNETAEGDKIYNGAVDNATGIAAILEIAEKMAAGEQPRRSVIFAAVTAEESGLLGSAYMAENPPAPLNRIVGAINIDAILPTPPAKDMIVVGYGASALEDILKEVVEARGGYLRADPEPEKGYFYRSDHVSFAKKGVPVIYADGGFDLDEGGEAAGKPYGEEYTAVRYHQPADEFSEDWRLDGIRRSVETHYGVGARLAASSAWPNWREGNEFRGLRDAMMAK